MVFEMGYIDGFEDIMAMETGFLQYMIALLKKDYTNRILRHISMHIFVVLHLLIDFYILIHS